MHYLQDLESRVEEVRRQTMDFDQRARERMELLEELEGEHPGLRRRLASALITLGTRIDPEAVEAVGAGNEAA